MPITGFIGQWPIWAPGFLPHLYPDRWSSLYPDRWMRLYPDRWSRYYPDRWRQPGVSTHVVGDKRQLKPFQAYSSIKKFHSGPGSPVLLLEAAVEKQRFEVEKRQAVVNTHEYGGSHFHTVATAQNHLDAAVTVLAQQENELAKQKGLGDQWSSRRRHGPRPRAEAFTTTDTPVRGSSSYLVPRRADSNGNKAMQFTNAYNEHALGMQHMVGARARAEVLARRTLPRQGIDRSSTAHGNGSKKRKIDRDDDNGSLEEDERNEPRPKRGRVAPIFVSPQRRPNAEVDDMLWDSLCS